MAGILLNRNRQVPAEETPAFGGIAERFRRAGDLDRAIALCRDGLQRFPEQLSARVTLGWALLDKGQYDAARAELEQVLRKAPDNLAAIRGLAELHDRSEGAMSADSEQESWRTDEPADVVIDQAALDEAAEPGAPLEPAHFAPIQVDLGGADQQASPEVLHTAAHAEMAAGEAETQPVDLVVAPVELEDAAAVSMAAAAEPAPFFVVDPAEAEVEAEIESASARAEDAAIDAFDAGGADLLGDAAAMDLDVAIESAASATVDAASPHDAGAWDEADALANAIADAGPDLVLEDAADTTDAAWTSPITAIESLETLDDVDEAAGQDLADAIRALEAASKRVEAKLAVPPPSLEPAAGAEEIAAFEFVDATSVPVDEDARFDHPVQPVIETGHDGSFELVAPDLASVELEAGDEEATGLADLDDVDGEVEAHPALSFDAPAEADSLEAAAGIDLSADTAIAEATFADAFAETAFIEAAPEEATGNIDTAEADELTSALEAANAAGLDDEGDAVDQAALVASVDATVAVDEPVEEPTARETAGLIDLAGQAAESGDAGDGDDSDEPPADAAAMAGEWTAPVVTFDASTASAFVGPAEEPAPDDAAVGAQDAEAGIGEIEGQIAALVAADPGDAVSELAVATATVAMTKSQRTLLALERFLRQVQARQLALRSETVA